MTYTMLLWLVALCSSVAASEPATFPLIPEQKIPIEELRVSGTAYAAVRKPPGEGRFPTIVFLHGGLGRAKMEALRENSVRQPTPARFLAWGYVTVTATRRAIRHDPQDRGVIDDTLAIVREVKKLPYVDPRSIALYGGSGGGTLALEIGSVTGELAVIVAGEPATIIYMGMFTKDHVNFDENGRPKGDRRWDVMNADAKALYTSEIREHTRKKLKGLSTPTLILHGDQHPLKKFNFGVFIPEMKAMGKPVTVKTYAGEPHGFYWGRGRNPAVALQANRDAEVFLRKHQRAQPKPVDESWTQPVAVEPLARPDPNQ